MSKPVPGEGEEQGGERMIKTEIDELRESILASKFNLGVQFVSIRHMRADGTFELEHEHRTDGRGLDIERARKVLIPAPAVAAPLVLDTVNAEGKSQQIKVGWIAGSTRDTKKAGLKTRPTDLPLRRPLFDASEASGAVLRAGRAGAISERPATRTAAAPGSRSNSHQPPSGPLGLPLLHPVPQHRQAVDLRVEGAEAVAEARSCRTA